MLGEHHDAGEFLERDVVQAVVRVKQGPVLGDHRQVLIQQVKHLLPVEADVFWAGLLVVADHDGLLGQGEQRQCFQPDLGCFIDDEDIEGRVGFRPEAAECPRGGHDPHRDGVLRLVLCGPDFRQPALGELAACLPESGHGSYVAVERLPLPVSEVAGQAAPGAFADQFGDNAPSVLGQFFEPDLELGGGLPGESFVYPASPVAATARQRQGRRDQRLLRRQRGYVRSRSVRWRTGALVVRAAGVRPVRFHAGR